METSPVAIQAFRYLDIRTPKVERQKKHPYVVDRALLRFDETEFERTLKSLDKSDNAAYLTNLKKAADEQAKKNRSKLKISRADM